MKKFYLILAALLFIHCVGGFAQGPCVGIDPPQIICMGDTTIQPQTCDLTPLMVSFSATSTSGGTNTVVNNYNSATASFTLPNINASVVFFFPIGSTAVTFTVTDACANTATCSFTVTVSAPPPPEIIACVPDTTVDATSCTGALVSSYSSFIINNPTVLPMGVSFDPPLPSTLPVGTNLVTMSSTICENTATCQFHVTVNPLPLPVITCPQNITMTVGELAMSGCNGVTDVHVFATSDIGLTDLSISNPPVHTHDNIPTPSWNWTVNDLEYPVGTTTVTLTATDMCGGTSTCEFTVTVLEAPPPVITCPANIILTPNAAGCSATTSISLFAASSGGLTDISLSHPAFNSHSLIPTPSWNLTLQDATYQVGTTTVIATAKDVCGHTGTCSFDVTVLPGVIVDAGPDVSSVFGYPSTQTISRTATVIGGTSPYSYSWSLSRPLKCNQVNSAGDELFTGGTCTNNICPSSGSATSLAPACTGSNSISATLMAGADACVTVTDANGCIATDCFHIDAVDGRCFTGNAGKNKAKICHQTGSASNPGVTICIAKSNLNSYLTNHPGDYLGPCVARLDNSEEVDGDAIEFFPNPSHGTGIVRFTAPEDAHAQLEIFSYTGARVATLFNGNVNEGEEKEIPFDRTDLTNGIYFCKLTVGNEVYYTKIIFDK